MDPATRIAGWVGYGAAVLVRRHRHTEKRRRPQTAKVCLWCVERRRRLLLARRRAVGLAPHPRKNNNGRTRRPLGHSSRLSHHVCGCSSQCPSRLLRTSCSTSSTACGGPHGAGGRARLRGGGGGGGSVRGRPLNVIYCAARRGRPPGALPRECGRSSLRRGRVGRHSTAASRGLRRARHQACREHAPVPRPRAR